MLRNVEMQETVVLSMCALLQQDPNFKFSPIDDVDKFIVYYRTIRKHKSDNERVLYIHFEDMVYNLYNHTLPKKIFDPARSINNTQLLRLHPEEQANVDKICKALPEFLYDFEKYKNIVFQGQPFDGAARKQF